VARLIRARKAGSPLIVIPTASSSAIVLRAVKVWPSKGGACRKVGATANLDSSCARRPERSAGRDEETGFRSNKETDEGRKDALLLKLLDKKSPIQGNWPNNVVSNQMPPSRS
jgi:hypothetical protein